MSMVRECDFCGVVCRGSRNVIAHDRLAPDDVTVDVVYYVNTKNTLALDACAYCYSSFLEWVKSRKRL